VVLLLDAAEFPKLVPRHQEEPVPQASVLALTAVYGLERIYLRT
jgi:hypothetical protein